MFQIIAGIINNVNWSLILLLMSSMVIINFLKYNDPNPKVGISFANRFPQLVLTYEYYEIKEDE